MEYLIQAAYPSASLRFWRLLPLEQLTIDERGSGADHEHQVRGIDPPPAGLGRHGQLEGHLGSPAARLPAPSVTRCRSRTVAKVDSIGFVDLRWTACSAG